MSQHSRPVRFAEPLRRWSTWTSFGWVWRREATLMRAIGYTRSVPSDQSESGLGLAAQDTAIRAAAERLHLTVEAIYVDAGLSGSLGIEHRRGLADALNALRPGDTLLVAKRDRIARDAFLSVLVERAVMKKGARTISCAGEGNGDGFRPASSRDEFLMLCPNLNAV